MYFVVLVYSLEIEQKCLQVVNIYFGILIMYMIFYTAFVSYHSHTIQFTHKVYNSVFF